MLQAIHLDLQQGRVTAIPTVADNQDNGAASQHSPRPLMVEEVQGVADARSTRPVLYRLRNIADGIVNIAPLELARYTRQPRTEDKCLDIDQAVRDRMDKVQQQSRVQAHRPADVTDDYQGPGLAFNFAPGQFDQFCAMLQVTPHHAAHIKI